MRSFCSHSCLPPCWQASHLIPKLLTSYRPAKFVSGYTPLCTQRMLRRVSRPKAASVGIILLDIVRALGARMGVELVLVDHPTIPEMLVCPPTRKFGMNPVARRSRRCPAKIVCSAFRRRSLERRSISSRTSAARFNLADLRSESRVICLNSGGRERFRLVSSRRFWRALAHQIRDQPGDRRVIGSNAS